ncbi:MAG: hypothetical protein L6R42_010780, partial [Xanthoria sp. 1 TBL-2021]
MRWKAEPKEEDIRARVPAIKTRTGTVMAREEDIKTWTGWFLSAAANTTVKSTKTAPRAHIIIMTKKKEKKKKEKKKKEEEKLEEKKAKRMSVSRKVVVEKEGQGGGLRAIA